MTRPGPNRRDVLLALAAGAAAGVAGARPLLAQDAPQWRHGVAFLGGIKYPAGFKAFDYVNPDAPTGGGLRMAVVGTFDSLNTFIVKGNPVGGMALVYETLFTRSLDEPGSQYGLLAEAMWFPPNYSAATYRLRPEARWHDGQPVTAEDVIWSFRTITDLNPRVKAYYSHVKSIAVTGEREVTFTFNETGNRELPLIVGELTVLPKHWWEGADAAGKKRNIAETTLEIPLGSGPYRMKSFDAGNNVVFERVKDYWGAKVPAMVGTNNLDEIRYDYYRDPQVALEAFKGGNLDARIEASAKNWATAYDFPARTQGRVILEKFPIKSSGSMQSFTFNLRRDLFKDARVREALDLAFDFEEMNRTLFFGQYFRTSSYFAPMDLGQARAGLPGPAELAILEPLRDKVPPEVFTTEYVSPVNGDPAKVRENLRRAFDLLKAAGYENTGGKLVHARTKQPFAFEILIDDPTWERISIPYTQALKRLGIDARIRTVDDSQYQNLVRDFNFDMIVASYGQSISPGNEQLDFWGSKAADMRGSGNYAGIKNPAVDAIIDKIIYATDRDGLVAACRALDRVLLWNHYVIPQWHYGFARIARWDRFSHADTLPEYGASGFPDIWWYDTAKAAKTGARS